MARDEMQTRHLPIRQLKPGMILKTPVVTRKGLLLAGFGQEVTEAMLARLQNFMDQGLPEQVEVLVPPCKPRNNN